MIASWMVYLLLVSVIVSGAGIAFERTLGALRLPTRYAWTWSLLVSTLLPIYRFLVPHPSEAADLLPTSPVTWMLTAPAEPARFDPGLLLACAWVALVGVVGLTLLISHRKSLREIEGLPEEEKEGHRFLRATDLGPALIGAINPRIVLPEWLRELDPRAEPTALWHESAHLRSADPVRVHVGLLCVCLQPWNPLVWWQFARLRESIERDCDRRVVASGAVGASTYSRVLIDIAERSHSTPLTAVAFKPTRTQLGRRVVAMTDYRKPPRLTLAATLGTAAIGLLVVACDTQEPLGLTETGAPVESEVEIPTLELSKVNCSRMGVEYSVSSSIGMVGFGANVDSTGTNCFGTMRQVELAIGLARATRGIPKLTAWLREAELSREMRSVGFGSELTDENRLISEDGRIYLSERPEQPVEPVAELRLHTDAATLQSLLNRARALAEDPGSVSPENAQAIIEASQVELELVKERGESLH